MASSFQDKYKDVVREYRETPAEKRDDVAKRLREQTLERADRREWAHKRRGDEKRFNE